MASSSTSSIRKSFKYDVFLSFRGEDIRRTFVDHLYNALQREGIRTYKDDERIRKGRIHDEILRSIEDSKFFIIVLSKNYASSSWCLDELVAIMKWHKTNKQIAYPVFYDVNPSEVRNQTGVVGEAFAEHKKEDAAGKWRQALQEVADLDGWELRNATNGQEVKFIQKIVEEVSLKLDAANFSHDRRLIGIEPRIKEVLSLLETGSGDVRFIGIKGMGGIGKKTLAGAIFDKVSSHFEGRSFVENVREASKAYGLLSLQKRVLSDVLHDRDINVSGVSDGQQMMKRRMHGKKVLVVLDDVDHIDQLEALAGEANWFGEGSRIIITTRDEKLLLQHGVQQIYHVDVLSDKESLGLFSMYAFRRAIPVQGYEQLSRDVVHYAAGLPLTIKVLGSLFFDKSKPEWRDYVDRLKVIPLKETMKILELSYISLEDDHKEIFLDVACFMIGMRENDAIRILESCGFPARYGLAVLQRKSLLTTSNQGLRMHDSIREMGRDIVRRSYPCQPEKHSRLWIQEEVEAILADDLGTEATGTVELPKLQLSPNMAMEGFGRMKKLRCLFVESETDNDDLSRDWEFEEGRQYLPNALRFLRWVYYPVQSLPGSFQANNLVALELSHSRITQLWEGGERKVLYKLRFLDLSYSKLETLDLELTPKLEWLELKECNDLVKLQTPDGSLKYLVHLNLVGCSRFKSFSYIKQLESMGVLSLSKLNLNAKSLKVKPRYASHNLPMLQFTCLYFEDPSLSNRNCEKFVSINLQPSTNLESVSRSICCLQHLRQLTFSGPIPEVPKDLDQLTYLEKLILVSTHIKCLPDRICGLKNLKVLKLKFCVHLEKLPEGLDQLECLEKLTLLRTKITCLPDRICKLKHLKSLKLKSCSLLEKLPEDLGQLEYLEKLNVSSARIRRLPGSICMLKHLKSLELDSCGILENLPVDLGQLKHLEKLILTKCMSLEDIPQSICEMDNLECFHLIYCDRVKALPVELGRLKCLRKLNVKGTGISHLPQSVSLMKDVRIVGSAAVLRSLGLELEIQNLEGETFCYIQP